MNIKKIERIKEKQEKKKDLAIRKDEEFFGSIESIDVMRKRQSDLVVKELYDALPIFQVVGSSKMPILDSRNRVVSSGEVKQFYNSKTGKLVAISTYDFMTTKEIMEVFSCVFDVYKSYREHVLVMLKLLQHRGIKFELDHVIKGG